MKTAKEMFEELGYKIFMPKNMADKDFEDWKLSYAVVYRKYCDKDEECYEDTIWFDRINKNIEHEVPSMDIKLLKAINKQVEELGWNNE